MASAAALQTSLWPALPPGRRIEWGAQSTLISARVCKDSHGERGQAHPQRVSVQGSIRAWIVGVGDRRALEASPARPAPLPSRRLVVGQSTGSGGFRDAEVETAGLLLYSWQGTPLKTRCTHNPRVYTGPQSPPTLPPSNRVTRTCARACGHSTTSPTGTTRGLAGPISTEIRVLARPHYAAVCGPRPTLTLERCVHTQTAGRGRQRLTPGGGDARRAASHPSSPLHTAPPFCSRLPPNPSPANSTKPNSQHHPDGPPLVF